MMYFYVPPEVAGGVGANTVMKREVLGKHQEKRRNPPAMSSCRSPRPGTSMFRGVAGDKCQRYAPPPDAVE